MTIRKFSPNKFLKYFIILLIITVTALVSQSFSEKKTIVLFDGLLHSANYYVNHKAKLFLTESKYYNFKKSLNNLSPGKHIIHYDTSPVTRYYSMINVSKGRNIIKPEFEFHSLPLHSIYRSYDKKSKNLIKSIRKFEYTSFDDHGIKKANRLEIGLTQAIKKTGTVFNYIFEWDVFLNDKSVSNGRVNKSDKTMTKRSSFKKVLFKNSTHRYYVEGYYRNGAAKLKIWAEYI